MRDIMKIKLDYLLFSLIFLAFTYVFGALFIDTGILIYLIAQLVLFVVAFGLFRKGIK